jgi:ubiquinone/menaquinone biosynthesis C-methylase UbiE
MADMKITDTVRERFEKEAYNFDSIYQQEEGKFLTWFNRYFRAVIFERYDVTFEVSGDVTGKAILDVGCGSGIYAVKYGMLGARRVVGVDFSAPMLDIARQRAREQKVDNVCEFIQADFLKADIKERFNISIAMGVFDYVDQPVEFLSKMRSVTDELIVIAFPGHQLIREQLRKLRYKIRSNVNVHFFNDEDVAKLAEAAKCSSYEVRPYKTGAGYILIAKP